MDGAHAALLQLGRHPQRRLQAGAGRHQPLPGRLEQPDAGDAAAGGAGRAGRDREDLPGGAQPAGDPGEPRAQHLLPGQRGAAGAHLPHGGAQRARGLDRSGDQVAQEDRAAERRDGVPGAGGARQAAPGPEELRPLHHPAEQRPLGRRARHPGRPARAVPAAAAARRLVGAPQEQPLPQLRGSVQALRQAAGHRPLADQPDVRARPATSTSPTAGHGRAHQPRRRAADQGPPQVQGIRHQREALRGRQGRQRHPRHGRA